MEPEVEIYYKKDKKKDCTCIYTILFIVAIALVFFIGALVQFLTGFVATLGLGAIVVLIIALALLTIIGLIALFCCKKSGRKGCCN